MTKDKDTYRYDYGRARPNHVHLGPQYGTPRVIYFGNAFGPARTLEDMTSEEIEALERQYGCKVRRPGDDAE